MMPPSKAVKILKDFEAVVKTEEKKYDRVFSEHSLPHSRGVIKDALKSFATKLHQDKTLDEAGLTRIKTAYAQLGMFASPEDADFVKEYRTNTATQANLGMAERSKKFQFIMNKVRIQEEDSVQECKVFLSRLINDKILGEPGA